MKVLLSTLIALFLFISVSDLKAQDKNWFQVYGFAMTDIGYNANQIHPDWYDVVRPTKLPTYKNEYGTDGNVFFSVRQTRFGVKSSTQTAMGELFTQFEWELFGTGGDAGQTTFRLRHAYGELGSVGVGQTWSPFMDIDVFPNSFEYWGPNGMVFFRNIQVRWMPIKGDTRLTLALERPGASGDQGIYSEILNQNNVIINSQFPLPDFSAEYRSAHDWGYVELAGIVRYIKWVDNTDYPENADIDLSDEALGWGLNLSSNLKITTNDVLRLAFVYGEGIQNYMNDATVDIGIKENSDDPQKPIKGVPLPMYSAVVFLDHTWNEKFSTAIGYSMLNIDNSDGQTYDAFHRGQYALANLIYYPVPNVMMGAEVQWGNRENFNDRDENVNPYPEDYLKTADIIKVQFSFKYNFSTKILY